MTGAFLSCLTPCALQQTGNTTLCTCWRCTALRLRGTMTSLRCHSLCPTVSPRSVWRREVLIVLLWIATGTSLTLASMESPLWPVYAHHCVSHYIIHNLQVVFFYKREDRNERGTKPGWSSCSRKQTNNQNNTLRLCTKETTPSNTGKQLFHLHT